MSHVQQVNRMHYRGAAYRSLDRWTSYWHQIDYVRKVAPTTVLEIGLGEGVVTRKLQWDGITVTTADIAEDLQPDVVASVTNLPLDTDSFDLVLAAEILEHIPFAEVPKALSEIARVARKHVVISVPHPGWVFSLTFKLPLMRRTSFLCKIPFFWKEHVFNGEHYWELGKRGYTMRRFLSLAQDAGLTLMVTQSYADDPAHQFFLFSVRS